MSDPIVFASSILNPEHLLESFGVIGLFIIIFLESCFAPLPGDSLLFSAGLLASQDKFGINVWIICLGCSIAAVAGNQAGYWFGARAGSALYSRPDSRWFKQEHLERTHAYFEKYGPKTIILARFVPIVRGFAPIVAGAARMRYRTFVTYNIVGGIGWAFGFIVAGWSLGKSVPNVDAYILPVVVLVIVVTSIPVVIEYYRQRKHFRATPSGAVSKTVLEEIEPE